MGDHMYYIYSRTTGQLVAKFNHDALLNYYPASKYEIVIY